MTPFAEKGTHASWQLLALVLLVLAAEAVRWLLSPDAHPGAPTLQTATVVLQGLLAVAGAFWCWHHGHRHAH